MSAVEQEDAVVVEIIHRIQSVMAVQAIRAEIGQMEGHEGCIPRGMALFTGLPIKSVQAVHMTYFAVQRAAVEMRLVADKAETRFLEMVERNAVQQCGRPPCRVVTITAGRREQTGMCARFDMAGGTVQRGICKLTILVA